MLATKAHSPETIEKSQMNIVVVGHVDHGKSTIVGRLLADTGVLPEGKLEKIKQYCANNSKPFEYAFLIDALKDEREQGITIDAARVFFKSERRNYILIDAPGHIEFVRNMVTGASRAEAALLVIDAEEGIKENSLRHGYLLSILGIKQTVVLVNKMDLVKFSEKRFKEIVRDYSKFLSGVGISQPEFIPVAGTMGENLASQSQQMSWYEGRSVMGALDNFEQAPSNEHRPVRLPVQGVYKFTEQGDKRRIIAGTMEGGVLRPGDELMFLPSGKKSRVKSIEAFNAKPSEARAEEAVGLTLAEDIYVRRGEVATSVKEPCTIARRVRCNVFWLGSEPLRVGNNYQLKNRTTTVEVTINSIEHVFDAGEFKKLKKDSVDKLEVAECILEFKSPIALDLQGSPSEVGSRFVLVNNYRLCGGGQFQAVLEDPQTELRGKVHTRNLKWVSSKISKQARAERYNQIGSLVMISGPKGSGRQSLAETLEKVLFRDGHIVYYLRMGNLVHGVDLDIESNPENRAEHIRRMAEVVNLFVEAGLIIIVTAADLTAEELESIYTVIGRIRIQTVWVGPLETDFSPNLHFDVEKGKVTEVVKQVSKMKEMLRSRGIIFNPNIG